MGTTERYVLAFIAIGIIGMIVYDRQRVKSGIVPLLAETTARLQEQQAETVGMSATEDNPVGVAYMNQNSVWGWPLPSMLPNATG
jgi:hypothetical protein